MQGEFHATEGKSSHGIVVEPRTSRALLLSTCLDLKSTHVDLRVYVRG